MDSIGSVRNVEQRTRKYTQHIKPYNDKHLKTYMKEKSCLNSLKKWDIENGNTHDRATEQKGKRKTKTHRRIDQRELTNTSRGAKWGDDTNPTYTKTRDIPTNLRKLIKNRAEIISVLADGHCLFRSVGKILHMEPGTVMKQEKAHITSRLSNKKHVVSETETATRVTRYTKFWKCKTQWKRPRHTRDRIRRNRRLPDNSEVGQTW